MQRPISPAPVKGGARGQLPAYLSNGVIGLRVRDNPLVAGIALVSGLAGRDPIEEVEALAHAPYPLAVEIAVERINSTDAIHAVQTIDQAYDFETGELTTRLAFQPAGVRAELEILTFCSRRNPNVVCQEVAVRLSGDAKLSLEARIDCRGIEGLALAHQRQSPGQGQVDGDGWLLWQTRGALSLCGVAFATEVLGAHTDPERPPLERGVLATTHKLEASGGRVYRLRQIAIVVPSAMHGQPDQEAARQLGYAMKKGFEALREENRQEWRDLWRSRIHVLGASEREQALIDATFFYMMSSAHGSSPASTSIFGLATWGDYHYYYGHVMWDIEAFAVPPYALLQPPAAQALLEYRSRKVEAAYGNARIRGRRGLQFPWESSPSSGEEAAPLPGSAAWFEDHVSTDVARAFALFSSITGDDAFIRRRAWPVLEGVAEWIASRVTRTDRGYEIKASMGAAERQSPCDNPALGIMGAQAALDDAMEMAQRLGRDIPQAWREVRDGLAVPLQDGLLLPHDGWRPGEEKGATPDSLVAFFPLWRDLGAEVREATIRRFLAMADQYLGSPMLSALYGVWASWIGDRDLAARLVDEGYFQYFAGRFDQVLEMRRDKFPEAPLAGPFVANMGGFLTALLMGFPGVRPTFAAPEAWPCRPVVLPRGWEQIRVEMLWARGRPYRLEAEHGAQRARITPL